MHKRYLIITAFLLISQIIFSQDKLVLRFMEILPSPQRTKILRGMLDEFEKENPGINVELISTPWNQAHQKLTTIVIGGSPPDVVEMPEQWVGQFASMDVLVNLAVIVARHFADHLLLEPRQ